MNACAAAAVEAVVAKCSGGVRVAELCAIGDRCVEERVGFLFKTDPSIEKGFAQPTTVSLNNVCYNCSPDADDELEVAAVGAEHRARLCSSLVSPITLTLSSHLGDSCRLC